MDTGRSVARPDERTTGAQHDLGEAPVGVANQQESHPSSPEQSGGDGVSSRGRKPPPRSTTTRVLVAGRHGNPAVPCHLTREPMLLTSGRARVHLAPSVDRLVVRLVVRVVVRLVNRDIASPVVTGVGIDPGSKFTGISVFVATPAGWVGLVAIKVRHRGQLAHKEMQQLCSYRRDRRSRNLRYPASSLGQPNQAQRLARPSLRHGRTPLYQWSPDSVGECCPPRDGLVHMLKMKVPGITGVEYQQGTLTGYEVRCTCWQRGLRLLRGNRRST